MASQPSQPIPRMGTGGPGSRRWRPAGGVQRQTASLPTALPLGGRKATSTSAHCLETPQGAKYTPGNRTGPTKKLNPNRPSVPHRRQHPTAALPSGESFNGIFGSRRSPKKVPRNSPAPTCLTFTAPAPGAWVDLHYGPRSNRTIERTSTHTHT